ncbi:glycosyltransferase [Corynebacterium sp. LaCa116]|uniref:CgeB family protein n=1 Tax=Corynebacterium sp. LaCa116 TaxID=3391423 RepID=UPI0039892089
MKQELNTRERLLACYRKTREPFSLVPDLKKRNVVAILDEFSVRSFSDFLNLWLVSPNKAELDLDFIQPDFLLVESAWNGNNGRWKYMVTSSSGPKKPLRDLVEACNQRSIPTVFWNKEDPPHFEDFIETAKLFDYIFTSDAAMIPRYQELVPDASVNLLQFAASPRLHSPCRSNVKEKGDVAFAGQYFAHKFPERREQMEALFPAANKFDFSIFSRALGGDPRYQFPEPYDDNVVGSLPYSEMVKAYRDFKVFLNVNSVVNSKTMCARRVFELSSCKTAVFGMESEAIRSVYSTEEITLAKDRSEVLPKLSMLLENDEYRRRQAQSAWRVTMAHHTYEHRIDTILSTLGLPKSASTTYIEIFPVDSSVVLDKEWIREFTQGQALPDGVFFEESVATDSTKLSGVKKLNLYLNPEVEYGKFFTFDLVMTLRQQDTPLVCKSFRNEDSVFEEEFTDYLPNSGWLTSIDASNFKSLVFGELGTVASQFPVYAADPFEVSSRTADFGFKAVR